MALFSHLYLIASCIAINVWNIMSFHKCVKHNVLPFVYKKHGTSDPRYHAPIKSNHLFFFSAGPVHTTSWAHTSEDLPGRIQVHQVHHSLFRLDQRTNVSDIKWWLGSLSSSNCDRTSASATSYHSSWDKQEIHSRSCLKTIVIWCTIGNLLKFLFSFCFGSCFWNECGWRWYVNWPMNIFFCYLSYFKNIM